ncbi:MAG: single-stranded-DNA-specific exonuclease RecJ [Coriobacteriia bacterium]|nr:single-stranded-DNA-specific exonuclease RecJ [Coriobacteriia bacterium]
MQHPDTQWRLRREVEPADVEALAGEVGVSRLTAWALTARGVDDADAARRFLAPSLQRDWPDPATIPGLDEAADRVTKAVRQGERVIVFGDFDLDGVSASALLTIALREFGGKAGAIVPHRVKEGYGLTEAALARVLEKRPDLVVTVDCGISADAEVRMLREAGVDVVVTDHHEPGDAVPKGIPVADPKLAASAPELSGAGVALALVKAVGERLGDDGQAWLRVADLAAVGTVADVVPLTGPNRALVAHGVHAMRAKARPGIRALAEVAGIELPLLTSENIAFLLAPRLNAAGRMDDPVLALRLLMTADEGEAADLAHTLDAHNRERQSVELAVFEDALAQIEGAGGPKPPAIVVAGEGWHHGVRGIVASRLVNRFGLPALVLSVEDGRAVGSGRSVPGLDLHGALARIHDVFLRFGGHEAAVGFALPVERLDEFRHRVTDALAEEVERLGPQVTLVDGVARLDEVHAAAVEMDLLEPFGFGNHRPLFVFEGVRIERCRAVGTAGQHATMEVHDGMTRTEAVMFKCPDISWLEGDGRPRDLIAVVDRSLWRGRERVRLIVQDAIVPA